MSVTIRLARIGKKNAPAFKIVVSNTRDKRNGKFLDILGHYNPSHNPVLFDIDKKKYEGWKGKGALSTKAVESLVEGTYEFIPYTRQNEEKKASTEAAPKTEKKETAEKPKEEDKKEEKPVEK